MKAVAITLPDRIELVKTLEKSLGYPITIFNAIKGGNYLDDFKDFKHPLPYDYFKRNKRRDSNF